VTLCEVVGLSLIHACPSSVVCTRKALIYSVLHVMLGAPANSPGWACALEAQ
jgi:hypothetical protein